MKTPKNKKKRSLINQSEAFFSSVVHSDCTSLRDHAHEKGIICPQREYVYICNTVLFVAALPNATPALIASQKNAPTSLPAVDHTGPVLRWPQESLRLVALTAKIFLLY